MSTQIIIHGESYTLEQNIDGVGDWCLVNVREAGGERRLLTAWCGDVRRALARRNCNYTPEAAAYEENTQ